MRAHAHACGVVSTQATLGAVDGTSASPARVVVPCRAACAMCCVLCAMHIPSASQGQSRNLGESHYMYRLLALLLTPLSTTFS